jgi:hypothetical protein
MNYLIDQKNELINSIDVANGCFDLEDRIVVLKQVLFCLRILRPMWVAKEYGYKSDELIQRIDLTGLPKTLVEVIKSL